MTTICRLGVAFTAASALMLAGCETISNPGPTSSSYPAASTSTYAGTGVVDSIERVSGGKGGVGGSGIGVGTIAGAVIGGVLGSQVGDGTGRSVATVVGAAGGAYAGHELEKRQQAPDTYRITVRMDGGSYQTLTQSVSPDFRAGDRVRIENGFVRRH